MTDWTRYDDATLMAEVHARVHPAFACLVQRHADRYYRLAYRLLHDRQEAEDVVQEAFVRLWERPALWDVRKNTQFTTWFYRVIVNACHDRLRRRRTVPDDVLTFHADPSPRQDETLQARQEQQALKEGLHALPERQRTALVLCFYEGLSNQQAADAMGVPLKALQSLLMRAKTTLKERMKTYA